MVFITNTVWIQDAPTKGAGWDWILSDWDVEDGYLPPACVSKFQPSIVLPAMACVLNAA
jgi:hypothetical protein